MAVFRNIEVDIPRERVTIEKQSNGKPALIKYVIEAPYDREKGYAKPKRTTIGHQCPDSKTKMHPTTQFADVFPSQWEKVSKARVKPMIKRMGMFSAVQAINEKLGIKDILDNVYGTDKAGAIIDFAMYSIIYHTNEASGFVSRMRTEMLYSSAPYSDTYYSTLCEKEMNQETELLFRRRWALQCKEDGVEEVWLCIDGSNDDCQSKGVEIAEHGHAKSRKNIDIVSFTYAVTTEGKPVTYDVYRGGLVDAKAMKKIIDFLDECGIRVKGVILDRGYCDQNAIRFLIEHEIAYVIMVKGHPEGYDQMVREYGAAIKMNAEYLIPHTYLFGYQQPVQLFQAFKHDDYLTLFFDYRNGSDRVTTLLKNLYSEMSRLEKAMAKGEEPKVESKYNNFLTIQEKEIAGKTVKEVEIRTAELQKSIDEKGLYGIVSSSAMTPREVHELYSARSVSETQYMQVKTQLGYGVVRVQYTQGVRSRFTLGFVASILRYEIEQASKGMSKSDNQMVQELENVEAQKINDAYALTHTENGYLKQFFKSLGTDANEIIDESVKYENDRLAGRIPSPKHRKTGPKKGSHRKQKDEHGNVVRRKSGVKVGTKRSDINQDGSMRKRPGVQKGLKRGPLKKDGTPRQKPGPKPGSHRNKASAEGGN